MLTFNKSLFPFQGDIEDDYELNLCLDYISIKCDKLTRQLNTDIFRPCFLFDFLFIKRNLELFPNVYDRLSYLESNRANFLQYGNYLGNSKNSYFVISCDEEIRKLRKILKYEKFSMKAPFRPLTAIPSEPPFKTADYIQKYIIDKICAIDASRWKYVFLSEQDFIFFVNLITGFFMGKTIDIRFTLNLQHRCKTRLCPILSSIYQKFDPTPLKYNREFLSLLKNLSLFKDQTDMFIYNALIRHAD